ncbi:DNA methyltransferase [Gordonia phage WilliamBoone]|nr:DNA methyltransferase [Gordonia phage WilliamBoone]
MSLTSTWTYNNRPVLLDLFCCAGGAAMGYHRAGFRVIGVDIEAQPNYPFEFHRGDALEYLDALPRVGHGLAAIHSSPPCQASTALTKGTNKGRFYLNLIPETRELLSEFDIPTVIENVQGADMRRDLTLCGEMFRLGVIRHRFFEVRNFEVTQPAHKKHRGRVAGWRHGEYFDGPYFAVYGEGGGKGTVEQWQKAMGIHWTDVRKEIAEAIPPAYSHYVGQQIMATLKRTEEVAS